MITLVKATSQVVKLSLNRRKAIAAAATLRLISPSRGSIEISTTLTDLGSGWYSLPIPFDVDYKDDSYTYELIQGGESLKIGNVHVVEASDAFVINLGTPTLISETLTVSFSFDTTPQDVDRIELWIDGEMAERRDSNSETDFVVNGITSIKSFQIITYRGNQIAEVSSVFEFENPSAPDVDLFTFANFKDVSILNYCSDPQSLALELDSVGKPDYGTIELTADDIIKWTKEGASDVAQGLVDYTIKNSAGLKDTGRLSLAFEEISITINTPIQNQEIPSDEDITVSFTVTPATQDYISAIALVVDGVEVEKRTPYSTADFTIDAGTLIEASHTIRIRAYDLDDVEVFETGQRNFEVTSSFSFGNALQFDGQDDFLSPSSGEFGNNLTSFTLSWWWKLQTENFVIGSLPSNNNGWFVYYATGFLRIGVRNSNVGAAQYSLQIPSEWTHFFVVYDGSLSENLRVQLYVDGQFVPIDSFTGNVAASLSATAGNSFRINSVSNLFGQGAIDELIMKKNYIGTAQQAADIYNNGQGADAAQIIPNPDRVYRFNESDPATVTVDEGAEGVDLILNNFTPPSFIPHT